MNYISLYRKYRPRKFSEIVGQEVVVTILKNSIINNKIGHAYIFSGPRGTGKTSIAKIFSKAVNCLNPIDGDLCDKCNICKQKFDEEIDIIEIDAASNNGVDEIREIRNNVKLMPSNLKYKVYIIDEVHMLSTSAFNALLKTLEEPPEHVIFILATTELNKIPITVLSRCQKFDFKKLSEKNIEKQIKYILEKENKELDEEIIKFISKTSDGGMRDAINLLDQILSLNKSNISLDEVYDLIGNVTDEDIYIIFEEIVNYNIKESLEILDNLYDKGKNFNNICDRLQQLIHNLIIYNNTENYFDKEYEKRLQKYSKVDIDKCIQMLSILIELSDQIKKTTNQKMVMEIYFIKMCLMFKNKIQENSKKEITNENRNTDSNLINSNIKNTDETVINNKKIRINNVLFGANKEIKLKINEQLKNVNEYVSKKEYNAISTLILKGVAEVISDKYILFRFKNNFEIVLFDKNIDEIEKLMKLILKTEYKVIAVTDEEWNKIREEYIENIKKGITYNFINEDKKINKNTNSLLENTIEDIFGSDYITEE